MKGWKWAPSVCVALGWDNACGTNIAYKVRFLKYICYVLNKLQHILLGIVVLALIRVFMLAVPGSMDENHVHALVKKTNDKELCTLSAITDSEDDDEPGRKKIKAGYTGLPVPFSYRTLFVAAPPAYIHTLRDILFVPYHLSSLICCWRI